MLERLNPEYQPKGDYAGKNVNAVSVTDVKTLVDPGIYAFFRGYVSDVPTSSVSFWTVIVSCYGVDTFRVMQIALGCDDNANALQVYARHSYHSNGSRAWANWTKLH